MMSSSGCGLRVVVHALLSHILRIAHVGLLIPRGVHIVAQLALTTVILEFILVGTYAIELAAGVYGCLPKSVSAGTLTMFPSWQ